MALNIPMPDSPGNSLLQGLNTGSNLIHQLMLNKYYNTLHPSGDVANAAYVDQVRKQFGENDPRYIEAKRAHDLAMLGKQSLVNYRDVLNQTAGIRATSPLGKIIAEGKGQGAQDIINNNSGFNARTPEEREAYERAINKQTSDTQTRNILNRAENLDITRKSINPDSLVYYSGPKGTLKFISDTIKAYRGNPSKEYLENQKAVYKSSLMAKQMRQFYGDSIQPSAAKKLEELSNPSSPFKITEIAKQQFEQLNKILDTETETYRKKGTSPIRLNKIDFKDGKFVLGDKNTPDEGNSGIKTNLKYDYLNKLEPQLIKINPKWTVKNIRTTVEKRGISPQEVINKLLNSRRGQ